MWIKRIDQGWSVGNFNEGKSDGSVMVSGGLDIGFTKVFNPLKWRKLGTVIRGD